MVIVEWTFLEARMDTKTVHKKKSITVHFISDQGTMIVVMTPEQATVLKEQLGKEDINAKTIDGG